MFWISLPPPAPKYVSFLASGEWTQHWWSTQCENVDVVVYTQQHNTHVSLAAISQQYDEIRAAGQFIHSFDFIYNVPIRQTQCNNT